MTGMDEEAQHGAEECAAAAGKDVLGSEKKGARTGKLREGKGECSFYAVFVVKRSARHARSFSSFLQKRNKVACRCCAPTLHSRPFSCSLGRHGRTDPSYVY
jgi:hypothetical protein